MSVGCLGSIWNFLRASGDRTGMGLSEVLTVSVTVNICVVIYCITLRIQRNYTTYCCKGENAFIVLCKAFENKTHILSKFVTEQLTAWSLAVICVVSLCNSEIVTHPFSSNLHPVYATLLPNLIAVNVGRYCYMLLQDLYLLHHLETSKYRTDTIHHLVTIICYVIFLIYKQNLLLAIIGITMELSTTSIELSKILKEMGKTKSALYKKMTLFSCIFTILFRGVVPVIFLIVAMFLETPFVMQYPVLTVFFLSIIFFSVINVWLILTTVQRLVRVYCNKVDLFRRMDSPRQGNRFLKSNNDINMFTKNNLGYMRRYDNKNLCYIEEDKLNIHRKTVAKDHLPTADVMQFPRSYRTINIPGELQEEVEVSGVPSVTPSTSRGNNLNQENTFIVRYHSSRTSDRSNNSGSALIVQSENGTETQPQSGV